MSAMASKITSLMIVCSKVYSDTDQRKHQSSASLAFVQGNHRWPVNSPHKGSVTWKCFHLMRSSWKCIMIIMGSAILVRQHLYIETASSLSSHPPPPTPTPTPTPTPPRALTEMYCVWINMNEWTCNLSQIIPQINYNVLSANIQHHENSFDGAHSGITWHQNSVNINIWKLLPYCISHQVSLNQFEEIMRLNVQEKHVRFLIKEKYCFVCMQCVITKKTVHTSMG